MEVSSLSVVAASTDGQTDKEDANIFPEDGQKHESLAFRTNVERRGIPIDDKKCLFCGRAEEDGAHLFIKCKSVKAVWRELAMEKERIELEDISSVHALLDYLWGLDLTK
ncbi:Threonine dehydratase [Hordeum vulgare]|nr:Threonine dehydratase [Hordeum vulgare]